MALICDCGCRLDISADERERLAATGEQLTCPQCRKSRMVRSQPANVDSGLQQLQEKWATERAQRLGISWFWMTMGVGMPIVIGIAIAIAEFSTRALIETGPQKGSADTAKTASAERETPAVPAEMPARDADAPPEPEPRQVVLQPSATGGYRIDRVTDKRGDGAFSGQLHRQIFVVYPNPPSEEALRKAVTEVYENALKRNRDPLGTLDVWIFETAAEVRDVVSGSPVANLAHCRDAGSVAPGAETLVSVVFRKQSDRPTETELELVRRFDKDYESFKSPFREKADKALFEKSAKESREHYNVFRKAAKERREELVKAYAVQFGLSELEVRRAIAKVSFYRNGKSSPTDADLDYWDSQTW